MQSTIFILLTCLWGAGAVSPPVPSEPTLLQDDSQNPVNVMMKDLSRYYVAMMSKGTDWTKGGEAALETKYKEGKFFKNLVGTGKIVGIVRTAGDADCRFLVFYKTQSKDEAQAIVDSTSFVKEKVLSSELYHVWGSRGLGKVIKGQVAAGLKDVKHENFYLGLFTKGKNFRADASEDSTNSWAKRHAETVLKWKSSGALKFYGIVDDTGPLRVIGVFSANSLDDANKLMAASPSVMSGWFNSNAYGCSVLEGTLP